MPLGNALTPSSLAFASNQSLLAFMYSRLSILLSNNRYYQFSGTAVISIFAEVDTLPSAKIQATVSYGNSNTDTAQRGLGMSGHIIGTFQGMLILWAVLWNQSVEDGFHIHTNIWICILIDAQSATGMLAEYIDDTRLRQLGQLTQNLTRYQVECIIVFIGYDR